MNISTKIIATIGPSCDNSKTIRLMYDNGMRIARLNFSHGNYEYFDKIIKNIRKVSDEIAILLDTKGPEIRSGKVENNLIEFCDKDKVILTNKEILGNKKILTINYKQLNKLKKGDKVLIDDGLIELEVISTDKNEVKTKVLNGGKLGSSKTVSLRGHNVEMDFLSKKDKSDIEYGIKNNFDFIAASFVRKTEDVVKLRNYLDRKKSNIRLISKIEHWEALENVEGIIHNSQGIMVARGDLGVEIDLQKVPKIQHDLIKRCNELGKPVIVATQMLESMKDNPRPTRAEISDVSHAILDGADAIMLSGETAGGKYPVKAVKMMSDIAKEYEKEVKTKIFDNLHSIEEVRKNLISMYVTKAAHYAAKEVNARAIITPTESGFTARKVSRFKPKVPIYAMTRDMRVLRQLQLSWGVFPFKALDKKLKKDDMIYRIIKYSYDKKLVKQNDKVVITSGHIFAKSGHTNTLEIFKVKHVLDKGK